MVFCTRYMDLFMYYVSAYNTLMKIFFISATAFIIYLMRFKKPYCTVSPLPSPFEDLRRHGRRLPPLRSAHPRRPRPHLHRPVGLGRLGVGLELQLVARGPRVPAPNRHAQQDQNRGEHNFALRGLPRDVSILLHCELDLQMESRRPLLLDPNSEWFPPDWPLCGLPLSVLHLDEGGKVSDRVANLRKNIFAIGLDGKSIP